MVNGTQDRSARRKRVCVAVAKGGVGRRRDRVPGKINQAHAVVWASQFSPKTQPAAEETRAESV